VAIRKSELYSSIWQSCDELRGGMDASQYKDYVLVLLFIKYISDRYAGKRYAEIVVPKGASFRDMAALKGTPSIGDDINKKIIAPIAEANQLWEMPDFNNPDKLGSGKDMVDRLTNLITIFENPSLDFSKNRAEGDDLLGDAYEYLMRNFATQSGKSKGNFYTPAEVSRIMAKVIGVSSEAAPSTTVYDPTCGSGSLLLRVADESYSGMSIYGQEMDVATAGLARMNMVIHGNATAVIYRGTSTLSSPQTLDENGHLKTFDFVVANPPFSYKSWTIGFTEQSGTIVDPHGRFSGFGVPPKKNGDYAFLLHIIRSLRSNGKGAVILPHGVLFRGGAEGQIRKNIIQRGYIKGIIGLPPNLFYGTGIPACIIVLDKGHSEGRKGIFMIDASTGFMKDGSKNRLREQDIHKIVDVFNQQTDVDGYSRMVPVAEIERNEFNLNIPRYVDRSEPEDIQDIEAHLQGDVPNADIDALGGYWDVCPSLRETLFAAGRSKRYSRLVVETAQIRSTIHSHPEFAAYNRAARKRFGRWKQSSIPELKAIAVGDKPKQSITHLGEGLLQSFSSLPLVDRYDIYQCLLSYWMYTMQDDVYVLVAEGWEAGRDIEEDPKKKNVWEGRLVPKQTVVNRYFDAEQKDIEELEANRDGVTQQIEEMAEEHGGEDGVLNDAINEKGKITKAAVQLQIKEMQDDEELGDEVGVLRQYLKLLEMEAELNKTIKEKQSELDKAGRDKYGTLSLDEIKTLLVEDKWLAKLDEDVQAEINRVTQRLAARIKELAERYENTLPQLTAQANDLEEKVTTHLSKMGFSLSGDKVQ